MRWDDGFDMPSRRDAAQEARRRTPPRQLTSVLRVVVERPLARSRGNRPRGGREERPGGSKTWRGGARGGLNWLPTHEFSPELASFTTAPLSSPPSRLASGKLLAGQSATRRVDDRPSLCPRVETCWPLSLVLPPVFRGRLPLRCGSLLNPHLARLSRYTCTGNGTGQKDVLPFISCGRLCNRLWLGGRRRSVLRIRTSPSLSRRYDRPLIGSGVSLYSGASGDPPATGHDDGMGFVCGHLPTSPCYTANTHPVGCRG